MWQTYMTPLTAQAANRHPRTPDEGQATTIPIKPYETPASIATNQDSRVPTIICVAQTVESPRRREIFPFALCPCPLAHTLRGSRPDLCRRQSHPSAASHDTIVVPPRGWC